MVVKLNMLRASIKNEVYGCIKGTSYIYIYIYKHWITRYIFSSKRYFFNKIDIIRDIWLKGAK